MSTAISKRVPKLTEKAKAAVEERQVLLNKLLDNSQDNANERATPSEATSTRPSLTKCKNVNSGDAVGKKAHKAVNVDEDVPTDEECACNSSPAVEPPAESPEDELGMFKVL